MSDSISDNIAKHEEFIARLTEMTQFLGEFVCTKMLVLISEGFPVDNTSGVKVLLGCASRMAEEMNVSLDAMIEILKQASESFARSRNGNDVEKTRN
jgi:hypothetical protein